MILGDTHGTTRFVLDYVFPTAKRLGVDVILQLGDYGYWEHEPAGVEFNDKVGAACEQYRIPLCFLRGNHDNLGHLLEHYWTTDERGFIQIRGGRYGLWFMPDGTVFDLGSVRFRVFGGAYSVDKDWRVKLEAKRNLKHQQHHAAVDGWPTFSADAVHGDHTGTIWFPDEEMSLEDFDRYLLEYDGPVDVILSHERPRSVDIMRELKDLPECHRTQDMLQRALLTHHPRLWMHGHYHHRYSNSVRSGDEDRWTHVSGLACDWDAAPRGIRPRDAWCLLDIDGDDGVPLKLIKSTAPSLIPLLAPLEDADGADEWGGVAAGAG